MEKESPMKHWQIGLSFSGRYVVNCFLSNSFISEKVYRGSIHNIWGSLGIPWGRTGCRWGLTCRTNGAGMLQSIYAGLETCAASNASAALTVLIVYEKFASITRSIFLKIHLNLS